MKFTDEQRLIVMMLADIQKALNVNGDFDPSFVSKMAAWKDEFAIAFRYDMIFDGGDLPDSFRFVINVVDMWSFIERAFERLDPAGRAELKERVGIWGENPKFSGFDGNNEAELMSHTRLLIEDLGRFEEFKGRDFNSHVPLEDRYAAMYVVFEPIRAGLWERPMNVDELSAVLAAR
ncbi:YfbU family protein [uncultured Stenotrophomonas sp.]|uniref:YfbU family protein n=1 Tax=uncultured Stenotrophomonas sp. TaxID=165438 RepID=UPI002052C918|nr:YfbU family protein [uncultured Stenotrophomonas sp.]DAI92539.1 MAG TPA: YfbU domain protein [Caudoviricetes sp.]